MFSVGYELVVCKTWMSVIRRLRLVLKHSTELSKDRVLWMNVKRAMTCIWVPQNVEN